jgi:hypothetical protein
MKELLAGFEDNLKEQLKDLATKIKSQESQLLVLKEGYLKVQGALELLDAINSKLAEAQEE